jgi:hypothetical protein
MTRHCCGTAEPGRHANSVRDPYRRFVATIGCYLQAQLPLPALLIHVLTAKRCALTARPNTAKLFIVATPVPAVVKGHNAESITAVTARVADSATVCAVHRLPNCSIVTSKTLPKPRTNPVALQ